VHRIDNEEARGRGSHHVESIAAEIVAGERSKISEQAREGLKKGSALCQQRRRIDRLGADKKEE